MGIIFFQGHESRLGALPSPKRLPAAQGFGRRGFAQAGETPVFRKRFDEVRHFMVQARVTNYFFSNVKELKGGTGSD
jgi:hypothetical protein